MCCMKEDSLCKIISVWLTIWKHEKLKWPMNLRLIWTVTSAVDENKSSIQVKKIIWNGNVYEVPPNGLRAEGF